MNLKHIFGAVFGFVMIVATIPSFPTVASATSITANITWERHGNRTGLSRKRGKGNSTNCSSSTTGTQNLGRKSRGFASRGFERSLGKIGKRKTTVALPNCNGNNSSGTDGTAHNDTNTTTDDSADGSDGTAITDPVNNELNPESVNTNSNSDPITQNDTNGGVDDPLDGAWVTDPVYNALNSDNANDNFNSDSTLPSNIDDRLNDFLSNNDSNNIGNDSGSGQPGIDLPFLPDGNGGSGSSGFALTNPETDAVARINNPEPGTMLLVGSGLAGLALRRRRNKKV